MSLPPESIEVGRCYLARSFHTGRDGYLRIRRVVEIRPDGCVQFDQRRGPVVPGRPWPGRNTMRLAVFATSAERQIPCDWAPGTDEGKT